MSSVTDKAKELLAKLTPKKWSASQAPNDGRWAILGPKFELQSVFHKIPLTTKENAEFIADAPQLVSDLCSEVERLTAELERVRKARE
jgi:hypothetical protein